VEILGVKREARRTGERDREPKMEREKPKGVVLSSSRSFRVKHQKR
jgi:hypothetical protein